MLTTDLTLKIERDSGDVMRFGVHYRGERIGEITSEIVRGKRGAAHGSTYTIYLGENSMVGVRANMESAVHAIAAAVPDTLTSR
jgi:hypothetical protein